MPRKSEYKRKVCTACRVKLTANKGLVCTACIRTNRPPVAVPRVKKRNTEPHTEPRIKYQPRIYSVGALDGRKEARHGSDY